MRTHFRPFRGSLLTPNATAETVDAFRRLGQFSRRASILSGTSDMLGGTVAANPSPTFYETEAIFSNISGRRPAMMAFEYHDSAWSDCYGPIGTSAVRDKIIAAANAGQMVALHHHAGNPVTGALAGVSTTAWPRNPAGAGECYDMSGSPMSSIKTGGAQEAQYLAYLDRLSAFLASLVDARGRLIPIFLRPFHELNGGWFWWSDQSNFVAVWQKMVTYLRDVKGVRNAIYVLNFSTEQTSNYSAWYPGNSYVDVLSTDNYDNAAAGASPENGGKLAAGYSALLALSSSKPVMLAETGYQYGSTNVAGIWQSTLQKLCTSYKAFGAYLLWRPTYGPSLSNSAEVKADFAAMVNDPRSVSLTP